MALIRISGRNAVQISRKLCPFFPSSKPRPRYLYFGHIVDPFKKVKVDQVLAAFFKKGHSFTGEDSVEISCHGGVFLSSLILDLLIRLGARPAERGEFSYRAFMNGQLDLLQAESILSLIQSQSPAAHAQALRGMTGQSSQHLKIIEKLLLKLLSHLEAGIDFSEQVISPLSHKQQKDILKTLQQKITAGLNNFEQGRINKDGFRVALLGAPNAGKSSLFNVFCGEEQAIVTPSPGTTRDVLTARILWNQREFEFKDTAGLRAAPHLVEKHGIQKTWQTAQSSRLCLFLVESCSPLKKTQFFGLKKLNSQNTFVVFSQIDKLSLKKRKALTLDIQKGVYSPWLKPHHPPVFFSSFSKEGLSGLKKLIYEQSNLDPSPSFFFTRRQGDTLRKIKKFLTQAEKLLNQKASEEFIAFELRLALSALYELLGRSCSEEVIEQIFKEFCIGK